MRKPVETLGFRLGMLFIPLLPRRVAIWFANLAGSLVYLFGRRERTNGLANLDAVNGRSKTDSEKRTILLTSLRSFAQTMIDVFWFSLNPEKRVSQYFSFSTEAGVLLEDRAQILITAHFGNWELMGLSISMQGIDVASIAATTKNPAVDRHLRRLRQKTGQTIIAREGALRTLIGRLRKGGKVAFVLDQNTRIQDGGIWVDFLGMSTPVSAAPAALAYRTGTEIVLAFSHPRGGGRYEARIGQIIHPPPYDKNADTDKVVAALTQQFMDVVGRQILDTPECWLWSYKHWRQIPPCMDSDRHPRYL